MTVAYFTPRAWVKRVCCVSKISSDCGCQSKEIGVGMEVRLLSVGTRGFFLAASRLAIAASPLNSVAPNEKKTSGTRVTKIRLLFAVFSVCFVIFYFRSVSSCSASSSDDCTKLVGESHSDSYLLFCVCSANNTKDCKYVW